jgi:hypothetical protein
MSKRPQKLEKRYLPPATKVTEMHGGAALTVVAPVMSGYLIKRGFRHLRRWVKRWLELNGRVLQYFQTGDGCFGPFQAKLKIDEVVIKPDMIIENGKDNNFILIFPSEERKHRWELRALNLESKEMWLAALNQQLDILRWLSHYKVGEVLGSGGMGVVRRLTDLRSGEIRALKTISVKDLKDKRMVESEVAILRNVTELIKHPNIVRIHKVYEENDEIFLFLDFCAGGELYGRIVKRKRFSERDAATIFRQLASALDALHGFNILHLDIKPENILFATEDEDSPILLTDFGLSRIMNAKERAGIRYEDKVQGTVRFLLFSGWYP